MKIHFDALSAGSAARVATRVTSFVGTLGATA